MKPITKTEISHALDVLREYELADAPLRSLADIIQFRAGEILGKREDKTLIGSYKRRGAFWALFSLSDEQKARGVICSSAGNHAQWFAHACNLLQIHGTIFMPKTAQPFKVQRVREFGGKYIRIIQEGDDFHATQKAARAYQKKTKGTFVHPFDNRDVIIGQATVTAEMLENDPDISTIIYPVGGGGLLAGGISARNAWGSDVKLIGVEPAGAASMTHALTEGTNAPLPNHVNPFVDGAAVRQVGRKGFELVQNNGVPIYLVEEWQIAQTMVDFSNRAGDTVEPAGALASAAVAGRVIPRLRGRVVAIVSGRCFTLDKMPDVLDRAEKYAGRRLVAHIEFPDRAGALESLLRRAPKWINIASFWYKVQWDPMSDAVVVFEGEPAAVKKIPAALKKTGFAHRIEQ